MRLKGVEKDGKLSPMMLMAAELLGSGKTRREAAEAIGVSERSIYNWRNDPAFREAVLDAERAFVAEMRPRAWELFSRHLLDDDKKIAQQAATQVLKVAEDLKENGAEKQVVVHFLYMPRPGEPEADA